ncbi:MAG: beta strand repeat-containing protein, partial [Xenococcaceae cyanobacterium]
MSFPENVERGNVSLNNGSIVNIVSGGEGAIAINSKNLELIQGSVLVAGIAAGLGNPETQAGDITIDATEKVTFDGTNQIGLASGIFNSVSSQGVGNTGNVKITSSDFSLTNGGLILSSLSGVGKTGDVTINASNNISFDRSSGITNQIINTGFGSTGNINISAKNFSLTNGGRINSFNSGQGTSGNVNVDASDTIAVDGNSELITSAIVSFVSTSGKGNAGAINLNTKNLSVTNGGSIQSLVAGFGNSGDLTINASDIVSLDGKANFDNPLFSRIGSSVTFSGVGNSGNVKITAKNLSITNGARIDASTCRTGNAGNINIKSSQISLNNNASVSTSNLGIGNAGNIAIEASDLFSANNRSQITSNIGRSDGTPSEGKVGSIEIAAKNVFFTNNAQIQAGFFANSKGESGIVSVKATDSISFDGLNSGIFTNVETGAIANGSDIKLEAKSISLSNNAVLEASNAGNGNGGNIDITSDRLSLDRSFINSSVVSNTGGNINFQIKDRVSLENKSQISSQATGTGSGGNININADDGFVVAFPNQDNDIIATSQSGQGGKIAIDATRVYGFDPESIQFSFSTEEFARILNNGRNDINSSSANPQLSGTVNINTEQLDPARKTVDSPQNIVEPEQVVSQTCSNNSNVARSNTFIISGRGGLPQDPTKTLRGSWVRVTGATADKDADRTDRSQVEKNKPVSSDEIIPARGMMINEKGQTVLSTP